MKVIKKFAAGVVRFFKKPGEFKKGYAAATGAVGLMISEGLVHGAAAKFWQSVIVWATFGAVVFFKNNETNSA